MSLLAVMIEKYAIRIETPRIHAYTHLLFPAPYTLFCGERSLPGSMLTKQTITCEEALHGELIVASQKTVREFEEMGREAEEALKNFLDVHFDEFWEAYQLDKQNQRQREQFGG